MKRTTKISSAKDKGLRLQKWICGKISSCIGVPWGSEDWKEIQSRPSGQHGTDVILRGEALKRFPFSIEAQSAERLNMLGKIQQSKSNLIPNTDWLVVLKNKTMKVPIVIMDANKFFEIYEKVLKYDREKCDSKN